MKENENKEPYPIIHKEECKACERCIIGCPDGLLHISTEVNSKGYQYAIYNGNGCNGCGTCYYTCPEPLAIEVHIPKKEEDA
jgi:2-oxoisovalerate ferredoxin oxidoreductase delta subunit